MIEQHWNRRYESKTVALLAIGFGLVGLDRWIISSLFPVMETDLHLTYEELGSLVGALGVAWGIASVIGGTLSDRFGRKRVLVPATIGFSMLCGLSGLARGFASLLAIRAIMGISEGAFCPTSFATVNEASSPSRRGLNLGIQQSAFPLCGLALGPILATQLLRIVSWRWVYALAAIPGLIVAASLARTIREPQSVGAGKHHLREPFGEILKHRNVPLGMFAMICAISGVFIVSAMVPSYLVRFVKLDTTQMGLVTSAIGLGGFLGQLTLPALSDFVGRRPVAVAGFLIGAGFMFAFSKGHSAPVLFALLFVACFCCFGLLGLITGPIAGEAAPRGRISSTTGIIVASGEIFGGGVAPVLAGFVAQHFGIERTLTMALVALAAGALICFFLRETAPQRGAAGQASPSAIRLRE
jgi:predicted MFS family arabinose efflux permease